MGDNNKGKSYVQSSSAAVDDDDNDYYDTTCGIGNWRPQWLQQFATPKSFVINFSIVAILQGAYFTYLIGSISTLEKRFAFDSKISGFIMIADNISQMFISPIIGYLGAKYNRSRLIASGELIVAMACMLTTLPYFIYGPGLHLLSNTNVMSNTTQHEVCSADNSEPECTADGGGGHNTDLPAVIILWLSSFANGLGYTAFYTIGLPYIDDNVQKKNSPLYISTTATLRLCGPALGFLLSSISLASYEDPFYDPHIKRNDPRWVGAWWLGFLVLGIAISIFSLPMFIFPKRFKNSKSIKLPKISEAIDTNPAADLNPTDGFVEIRVNDDLEDGNDNQTVDNQLTKVTNDSKMTIISGALKRLFINPVLIFHALAGIFRIFGYFGFFMFKPKYMELQYRQSASGASFFTGSTSVLTMAVGIMGGGIILRQFKPKARSLVLFMFVVELIASCLMFSGIFLGCPPPNFPHTTMIGNRMSLDSPDLCNSGCGCSNRVYQPICSSDGLNTYFSPCYAGCKSVDITTDPITFGDCNCVQNSLTNTATTGYCPRDCNLFPVFIILLSLGSLISSTARTGNTLITLRCVDPQDKSFAMGIIGSFFAVFAYIPFPLIFGSITDSTCLVWEESCGKTGNCWLYDIDKFRVYLHSAAFGFMLLGSLFDIGIIVYSDRLKNLLDDEEEDEDNDNNSGKDVAINNEIQLVEKTGRDDQQNGNNIDID
ncbi:solute carrier organic anion transporter family member 74D-like [Oppia nitens]|uniref:solute carrier organic anion transporter family member 74D-like n=1 Tax=Oppia nitens TaxID=1686743 RepID=UPI0023DC19FB|nr:solute carrier organic anion transporter family member 74D-like [Oppia nitens]